MPVRCRYCQKVFQSVGLSCAGHKYEHDWAQCAGDTVDVLRGALLRIVDSKDNSNWRKPECVHEAQSALDK